MFLSQNLKVLDKNLGISLDLDFWVILQINFSSQLFKVESLAALKY